MRTITLLLTVVLCGGCVSAGSQQVLVEGRTFRLVTGEKLRAAFSGQKIRYPHPYDLGGGVISSAPKCDGFYPDGRYLSCGDRVPVIHGTYRVTQDSVCIDKGWGKERCYQLYRSRAGDYLLGHPGEQPALEPIRLVPAADDTVAPRMF